MKGLVQKISSWRIASLGDSRGTAVIEFALTFPTLVIVTLMIFDMGRALFALTTINHLASEAARYASVRGADSPTSTTVDAITTYVENRAVGMDLNDLTISVTFDPSSYTGGKVEVQIDYNFAFFVSGFLPVTDITMSAESNMTVL